MQRTFGSFQKLLSPSKKNCYDNENSVALKEHPASKVFEDVIFAKEYCAC